MEKYCSASTLPDLNSKFKKKSITADLKRTVEFNKADNLGRQKCRENKFALKRQDNLITPHLYLNNLHFLNHLVPPLKVHEIIVKMYWERIESISIIILYRTKR